jgi:hypothetical protein
LSQRFKREEHKITLLPADIAISVKKEPTTDAVFADIDKDRLDKLLQDEEKEMMRLVKDITTLEDAGGLGLCAAVPEANKTPERPYENAPANIHDIDFDGDWEPALQCAFTTLHKQNEDHLKIRIQELVDRPDSHPGVIHSGKKSELTLIFWKGCNSMLRSLCSKKGRRTQSCERPRPDVIVDGAVIRQACRNRPWVMVDGRAQDDHDTRTNASFTQDQEPESWVM